MPAMPRGAISPARLLQCIKIQDIIAGFGIYEICHDMVITAVMTRSRSQLLI